MTENLLKVKLLSLAASGMYLDYKPPELNQLYEELDDYLLLNSNSLDSIELFDLYELQLHLSLITGHDVKAKTLIDSIEDQFNLKNSQRLKLLKSMYLEAIGDQKGAMKLLGKNKNELRLSRRLTTFSRATGSTEQYINNLNYYLSLQPLDLVTWAEIADQYSKIGHYDKAIFSLKEIILSEPFAYPLFHKVGLNYYYSFLQKVNKLDNKDRILEAMQTLVNARNSFLRCVEICDVYLASWLGIFLVSTLDFSKKLLAYSSLPEVSQYLAENRKLEQLSKAKVEELKKFHKDIDTEPLIASR